MVFAECDIAAGTLPNLTGCSRPTASAGRRALPPVGRASRISGYMGHLGRIGHVTMSTRSTRLAANIGSMSTAEQVWCVFDNTASGAAIENAWELRQRLIGEPARG